MRLIDIVGVSFVDTYPENLHRINDVEPFSDDEELPIVLIRNPANPHDANAIEVHQPSVGLCGHIPRATAKTMAPLLDAGEIYTAHVFDVRISPSHPDRPGLTISISKVTN